MRNRVNVSSARDVVTYKAKMGGWGNCSEAEDIARADG